MARVKTGKLAEMLGVSRQRIGDLAREGKLTRSADGRWDPDQARAELSRNLQAQQKVKARLGQAPPTATPPRSEPAPEAAPILEGRGTAHELFNRARAAKEMAIAKERQYALKKLEGSLLERDDVKRSWTQGLSAFKTQLLNMPDRLAPKVAALGGVLECREAIYAEVVAVLQALNQTTQADLEKANVA